MYLGARLVSSGAGGDWKKKVILLVMRANLPVENTPDGLGPRVSGAPGVRLDSWRPNLDNEKSRPTKKMLQA